MSIHWGRLGCIFVAMLLGLWLTGALGVWSFVKYYRGFSEVRYVDLLWPGNWSRYRTSEGDYYIAQAGDLLRTGETTAAMFRLRTGVGKSPANLNGRTLLARLYLAYRRPDLARDLLLDGLRYAPADPDYLRTTLGFLLEFQEDARLLEVADRLLVDAGAADPACRSIAAIYAATAAYHRGNFDRAEDLINQHRVRETMDGITLLARIEWERGYPELALLRLQDDLASHPDHDSARALQVGYYRALGRTSEWESAIIERLAGDPLAAAPRIEYLCLHHQRGDATRVEREIEAYLSQFQHDPDSLLLLADFAANTGRPALARRVQQAFPSHKGDSGAPALMVAESHIVAGEYQAGLDLIAGYARQYPEWTNQFASVCNGLQAVALYGLGKRDEARLHLDHLLAQKNLRAENLVAVSNRLTALGARDLALATLNCAVEADPLNQAALTSLIRLELDTDTLAALPVHLDRFIKTHQPAQELLARAYTTMGSDRLLFQPGQAALLATLRIALTTRRP